MCRCVIVSAAPISDYKKISSFFRNDDFFVFCDGGLVHKESLGVEPDLVVGDFDSFDKGKVPSFIETISLPREKDDTDTFFAIKECIRRGFSDFLLVGMVGNRFDHSLCNISALIYLYNRGKKAFILDDFSEMEIIGADNKGVVSDKYSYFSVMNVAGDVSGVTIKNAKYNLENSAIRAEFSLGVSNEVIPGKTAEITVEKGIILLVKVW